MTENKAWNNFITAAKAFEPFLDQWEKVKWKTKHGPIYLTISRSDNHPDSFNELLEKGKTK